MTKGSNKKVIYFSGPATNALSPPSPSSLVATYFFGIFAASLRQNLTGIVALLKHCYNGENTGTF